MNAPTKIEADGLYAALAAAQAELKNPTKDKEAVVKHRSGGSHRFMYADISDVLESVLPVLSKHGLAVVQSTKIVDGTVVLLTRIAHRAGAHIEGEYPVCALSGDHQSMGAAMTYARRYALTAMIGIAAVEDKDGEGAAPVGDIRPVALNAAQAKKEINWDQIEQSIDECASFDDLDKREQRVNERRGYWPGTYVQQALDRINLNRLQMARKQINEAATPQALQDLYDTLTRRLYNQVDYSELSAAFDHRESQLARI